MTTLIIYIFAVVAVAWLETAFLHCKIEEELTRWGIFIAAILITSTPLVYVEAGELFLLHLYLGFAVGFLVKSAVLGWAKKKQAEVVRFEKSKNEFLKISRGQNE